MKFYSNQIIFFSFDYHEKGLSLRRALNRLRLIRTKGNNKQTETQSMRHTAVYILPGTNYCCYCRTFTCLNFLLIGPSRFFFLTLRDPTWKTPTWVFFFYFWMSTSERIVFFVVSLIPGVPTFFNVLNFRSMFLLVFRLFLFFQCSRFFSMLFLLLLRLVVDVSTFRFFPSRCRCLYNKQYCFDVCQTPTRPHPWVELRTIYLLPFSLNHSICLCLPSSTNWTRRQLSEWPAPPSSLFNDSKPLHKPHISSVQSSTFFLCAFICIIPYQDFWGCTFAPASSAHTTKKNTPSLENHSVCEGRIHLDGEYLWG